MWAECCFRLLEYTRISSRYTIMEMSIILVKMSFMNLWKPAGALVSPSGITSHSKEPVSGLEGGFPFIIIGDAD